MEIVLLVLLVNTYHPNLVPGRVWGSGLEGCLQGGLVD